jgi:acyl dehydratase
VPEDKHRVIPAHGGGCFGSSAHERYAVELSELFRRAESRGGSGCEYDGEHRFWVGYGHDGTILAPLAEKIGHRNLRQKKHLCSSSGIVKIIKSIGDAKVLEGVEVGLSDWVVVDQHRIDEFAEATGDYQWIHVDTERAAKEMPNGRTIAHGYLTLSLIPALTANFVEFENLTRTINFGANKVRFYTPVPAGTRVRARATVLQARRRAGALLLTSEIRIEVDGERKPACVAETLGMYFFDE